MLSIPILGYVGPELIVPITSVIAAIGGFFLMIGRSGLGYLVGLVTKRFNRDHAENESA
jgi:hypothetical protein